MFIYYVALATAILIGILGQIAIKAGSLHSAQSSTFFLIEPFILIGLTCYFASALFYIFSLKQIPISVAFPSVSLSYVAVSILAHYLWNEPFGAQHILALTLIISGVFILVRA